MADQAFHSVSLFGVDCEHGETKTTVIIEEDLKLGFWWLQCPEAAFVFSSVELKF